MTRTYAELCDSLERQNGHLNRSLDAFKSGTWEEAERLASVAYILLADGRGRTKPLLEQLGIRDKIQFISVRSRALVYSGAPLCTVENVAGGHRYMPLFLSNVEYAKTTSWLSFEQWWQETVYKNTPEAILNREGVIRTLRDQDGGAHLDERLTEAAYVDMKSLGSNRIHLINGKPHITVLHSDGPLSDESKASLNGPPYRNPPIYGAHWATMAHIAWELATSIAQPEAQEEISAQLSRSSGANEHRSPDEP